MENMRVGAQGGAAQHSHADAPAASCASNAAFLARSTGAAGECGGGWRIGGRRRGAGRGGPCSAVRLAQAVRACATNQVADQLGQSAQQRRLRRAGGALADAPGAPVPAAGKVFADCGASAA